MNIDTVEFVLAMKHIVDAEFEVDPRTKLQKMKITMQRGEGSGHKHRNQDESDEDEEDDREYLNN